MQAERKDPGGDVTMFGRVKRDGPKLLAQTNSAIDKENVQALVVWRVLPPFGSIQLAYQRGTSEFGEQSVQGDTFFAKVAWVF